MRRPSLCMVFVRTLSSKVTRAECKCGWCVEGPVWLDIARLGWDHEKDSEYQEVRK